MLAVAWQLLEAEIVEVIMRCLGWVGLQQPTISNTLLRMGMPSGMHYTQEADNNLVRAIYMYARGMAMLASFSQQNTYMKRIGMHSSIQLMHPNATIIVLVYVRKPVW